jgi:hypothetical protein
MAALALLALGCAAEDVDHTEQEEPAAVAGTISMALTAETPNGLRFRMVDAMFEITGPTSVTFLADPDATTALSPPLTPGSYLIRPLAGWRMQRETPNGYFDVMARAVPPFNQSVQVVSGQTASRTMRFITDGQIVETGPGQIAVDIQVDLVEPGIL